MIQDPTGCSGSPERVRRRGQGAYRGSRSNTIPTCTAGPPGRAKMKEINAAYSQIMNRSTGGSGPASG